MGVNIRGGGVAAFACAHLLDRAQVAVRIEETGRPQVPAIMVGDATQALICDVFQNEAIFENLPKIDKRIVAWGPGAEVRVLPHSAVVLSEQQLSGRLRPQVAEAPVQPGDWTVFAAKPLPAVEHSFGTRVATAMSVKLKESAERNACWIESLENGWLFLIPATVEDGWLLSVGGSNLLESSRLIAPVIESVTAAKGEFPAYPRIANPLCDEHWLACGTAAMAFDPLCGDGTGNAAREAILAAAVIRAATEEEDAEGVRLHYHKRLLAGFQRHLEQCRPFYATGQSTAWWRAELEQIETGVEWCAKQIAECGEYRYQLREFDLVKLK